MGKKSDRLESEFWRKDLRHQIRERLPECVIVKQDPNTSFQGVPDHLILCPTGWAALETKRGPNGQREPNQEYYIEKFGEMSFAAFVDPTNMDEVLDDLQQALGSGG